CFCFSVSARRACTASGRSSMVSFGSHQLLYQARGFFGGRAGSGATAGAACRATVPLRAASADPDVGDAGRVGSAGSLWLLAWSGVITAAPARPGLEGPPALQQLRHGIDVQLRNIGIGKDRREHGTGIVGALLVLVDPDPLASAGMPDAADRIAEAFR